MTSRHATVRLAPLRLVAAASLALVALAGCGGSSPPASSTPAVATTTVDLPKSYRFSPVSIRVPVGTTVTWTNSDNFTHNVAFPDAAPLTMRPGETATRAFPTAGTFAYICSLHPNDMQGSVIVGP